MKTQHRMCPVSVTVTWLNMHNAICGFHTVTCISLHFTLHSIAFVASFDDNLIAALVNTHRVTLLKYITGSVQPLMD
jgi:hypothetical protein